MTEEEEKRYCLLGQMVDQLMADNRSARKAFATDFPGLGVYSNSITFTWTPDDTRYRLTLEEVEDTDGE